MLLKKTVIVALAVFSLVFAASFRAPAQDSEADALLQSVDRSYQDAAIYQQMMDLTTRTDEKTGFEARWITRESSDYMVPNLNEYEGSYYAVRMALNDHLLFTLNSPAFDPKKIESVKLRNDRGISVSAIKGSYLIQMVLPDSPYFFELKDAKGRPILSKDTKSLTLTAKLKGTKKELVFVWNTPLVYPPAALDAIARYKSDANKPLAGMKDEDLIGIKLMDSIRIDVRHDIIIIPIPEDVMMEFIKRDDVLAGDESKRKEFEQVAANNTIILVTLAEGAPISQKKQAAIFRSVVALDAAGKKLKPDTKATGILWSGGDAQLFSYMVALPKIKGGLPSKLTIAVPGGKAKAVFEW